jgi:hypothetical protein
MLTIKHTPINTPQSTHSPTHSPQSTHPNQQLPRSTITLTIKHTINTDISTILPTKMLYKMVSCITSLLLFEHVLKIYAQKRKVLFVVYTIFCFRIIAHTIQHKRSHSTQKQKSNHTQIHSKYSFFNINKWCMGVSLMHKLVWCMFGRALLSYENKY